MKSVKILGIYRHPRFSNNAIEADRLILEESIAQLERSCPYALQVDMLEEAEVGLASSDYDLVLTMAQAEESLQSIERIFPAHVVWNSPAAIRNCYRKTMSTTLSALAVNYVPFEVLKTEGELTVNLDPGQSYWLKRSDFHAICDEDVTLAESQEEMIAKLQKFRLRNVAEVILQKHIHGDIYKFYGVEGGFFRPIRVRNILASPSTPDFTELERITAESAKALGLTIFGGDAILDNEGKFHLIDVNDWPSFRICRDDASLAIAALGLKHLDSIAQGRKRLAAISASHA